MYINPEKTKRSHNTFIRFNQPHQHVPATQRPRVFTGICLREQGMLEIVQKTREITRTCERKSACKYKGRLTRFLSEPVLICLSLHRGRCTSFWRGYVWLLSTLLLRKNSTSCSVSYLKRFHQRGKDVCAVRKWILLYVKGWKAASGQTSKQDEGNLKL